MKDEDGKDETTDIETADNSLNVFFKNDEIQHPIVLTPLNLDLMKSNDAEQTTVHIEVIPSTSEKDHTQVVEASISPSNVYDFNEVDDEDSSDVKDANRKRKATDDSDEIIPAKLHRSSRNSGELASVPVGGSLKLFLANHPTLQGLYLNKGKRAIKKKLVQVERDPDAVDISAWKRKDNVAVRNRLDDRFELTPDGEARLGQVRQKSARDEAVVNWYLWCPGHGNCLRSCGEYGKCVSGRTTVVSDIDSCSFSAELVITLIVYNFAHLILSSFNACVLKWSVTRNG